MRVPLSIRRTVLALGVIAAVVLSGTATAGGLNAYTVRKGDTLSRLAKRFGVPVPALAEANSIGNIHFIRDGQKITIPKPGVGGAAGSSVAEAGQTHLVRPGESLATIARRYGTTVKALSSANRLTDPDHIRIGSRLSVPGSAAAGTSATWICPVQGQPRSVVNNWGAPRPGYRVHRGNDIFANHGTRVVAPVSGTLTHVSGSIAGFAFYLSGDDGHVYYGAHLAGYVHGPGRIAAGETIGKVGNTGNARTTPPHLHFEIHHDGASAVNPAVTLNRWC